MAGRVCSLPRHRLPWYQLDILVLESRFRRYGRHLEQRLEDHQYGQGIVSDRYYVPVECYLSRLNNSILKYNAVYTGAGNLQSTSCSFTGQKAIVLQTKSDQAW